MTELLTFTAQFVMVFALGFQSLNVNRGHYKLAALTSFVLGVTGYHLTAIIAHAGTSGTLSGVWWIYILAGPLAIIASMAVHQRMQVRRNAMTAIAKAGAQA